MSQPATAKEKSDRAFNITLTTVVVQVGCFTPIIILGGLFLGLWLDRVSGKSPLFTIIFILASMPVALIVLFAIVQTATKRLKSQTKPNIVEGGE
ncbi:MAG: hypothetical protein OHK0031_07500 [Anaerolineales bacterium]